MVKKRMISSFSFDCPSVVRRKMSFLEFGEEKVKIFGFVCCKLRKSDSLIRCKKIEKGGDIDKRELSKKGKFQFDELR